jgi:hypothetical protein
MTVISDKNYTLMEILRLIKDGTLQKLGPSATNQIYRSKRGSEQITVKIMGLPPSFNGNLDIDKIICQVNTGRFRSSKQGSLAQLYFFNHEDLNTCLQKRHQSPVRQRSPDRSHMSMWESQNGKTRQRSPASASLNMVEMRDAISQMQGQRRPRQGPYVYKPMSEMGRPVPDGKWVYKLNRLWQRDGLRKFFNLNVSIEDRDAIYYVEIDDDDTYRDLLDTFYSYDIIPEEMIEFYSLKARLRVPVNLDSKIDTDGFVILSEDL